MNARRRADQLAALKQGPLIDWSVHPKSRTAGVGTLWQQSGCRQWVLDSHLIGQKDPGEQQVYFEVNDYSTSYVFYEDPA